MYQPWKGGEEAPATTSALVCTELRVRQEPMSRVAGVSTGWRLSDAWNTTAHSLSSSSWRWGGQALPPSAHR